MGHARWSYLRRCVVFVVRIAFVVSWGHPHATDERARHPSQGHGGLAEHTHRVHSGMAVKGRREDQHHAAEATIADGGAEGLLRVDGISLPSTAMSLKLAWGRTPTLR